MKNRWPLILIFILSSVFSFGQNSYFIKNDATTSGIKLKRSNRSDKYKFCKVYVGDSLVKYSPYEVDEYSFDNHNIFFSKEIILSGQKKRVFLERLCDGMMRLYRYSDKGVKTYYIEKDRSIYIELPKKDSANTGFRNQLLNLTADCANVKDAIPFVSYNNHSLTELVKRYNRCEKSPFPHFRYGLTMGYGFANLLRLSGTNRDNIDYFDFIFEKSLIEGLFVEFPIYCSNYALHTELYYSNYAFSENKVVDNKDMDLFIHFSSVKMPVMIRYDMSCTKIRPFINAGTVLAKNFNIKDRLFEVTNKDNVYRIDLITHTSFIPEYQYGYCAGAGLEYPLTTKNSLFFELRLSQLFNFSRTEYLNTTELNFTTSINL